MAKTKLKYLPLQLLVLLVMSSHFVWAQTKSTAELITEARQLQESGDAEKSLSLLNEALEQSTFTSPQDANEIAEINNLQAVSYSMKYEWAKAIKYGLEARRRLKYYPKATQYPYTLYYLATFYAGRGGSEDYGKAIALLTNSQNYFDRSSLIYFQSSNNMVYYQVLDGKILEAKNTVESAIRSGERIFGDNKTEYVKQLWKYANMISELDQQNSYDLAITYAIACLRIMEENGQTHTKDYIRRSVKLAGFYYQLRKFDDEINTLTKIVQVSKEMDGEESTNYVDCLRKLALAYNHQENQYKGQRRYRELCDSCKEKREYYEGLSREILIRTGNIYEIRTYQIPLISNQAHDCFRQANYQEAIHLEEVAYKLYSKEKDTVNIANTSKNIASCYYHDNNQLDSALQYSRISIALYDKIPNNTRNKGLSYNNMAMYTHAKGNVREAVDYEQKAIETLKLCNDTLSDVYVTSLGNASVYCGEIGDSKNAEYYSALSSRAMEQMQAKNKKQQLADAKKLKRKERKVVIKKLQTTHHVDNNMALVQWNKAMGTEDPVSEHDAYSKASQIQRDVFLQDFPAMTTEERQAAWSKNSYIFDYAETLAFSYPKEDSLVMDAYNALLIRDGMPTFIQSCDSSAITCNWQTQAASLDANTAIVRFFATPTTNKGNAYSAFVLIKGWTGPKMVKYLFADSDMSLLKYDPQGSLKDIYKTDAGRSLVMKEGRYGRMVWNPILSLLEPSITAIQYATPATDLFEQLDPAQLSIEEQAEAISKKYKMTK